MAQLRLLTIEELKKYHTQPTSDFAFLLGAWQTEKPKGASSVGGFLKNFVDSPRFSSSVNRDGLVHSFYGSGELQDWALPEERDLSCPLALEKGSVCPQDIHILSSKKRLIDENDSKELSFLFGAYPQALADTEKAEILEKRFQEKNLTKTGNGYTFFEPVSSSRIQQSKCFEYEFNNERFVRMIVKEFHFLQEALEFSNGEKIQEGKPYWVKVQSLKWKVPSLRNGQKEFLPKETAYLQIVPLSGMTWDKIDPFLNERFSKEMMQSHNFCVQEYLFGKKYPPKSKSVCRWTVKLRD